MIGSILNSTPKVLLFALIHQILPIEIVVLITLQDDGRLWHTSFCLAVRRLEEICWLILSMHCGCLSGKTRRIDLVFGRSLVQFLIKNHISLLLSLIYLGISLNYRRIVLLAHLGHY